MEDVPLPRLPDGTCKNICIIYASHMQHICINIYKLVGFVHQEYNHPTSSVLTSEIGRTHVIGHV